MERLWRLWELLKTHNYFGLFHGKHELLPNVRKCFGSIAVFFSLNEHNFCMQISNDKSTYWKNPFLLKCYRSTINANTIDYVLNPIYAYVCAKLWFSLEIANNGGCVCMCARVLRKVWPKTKDTMTKRFILNGCDMQNMHEYQQTVKAILPHNNFWIEEMTHRPSAVNPMGISNWNLKFELERKSIGIVYCKSIRAVETTGVSIQLML